MFDAFRGDQHVGHFADGGRFSADHEDFKAIVVIQMHVQGGEDVVVVIVLDGVEFFAEQTDVMVVDKGDGADYIGVGRFPGLFDEVVADQVAEGFGAVGVSAPPDALIELFQKIAIDGNANPAQAAHAYSW